MDPLEQEWIDNLCAKAQSDEYLRSAIEVIAELNAAVSGGRPVNPSYRPILNQMLIAFGAIQVQEIDWRAELSVQKDCNSSTS